ncbi:MAG: DUF6724 family protein [Coriobacteriales bacterium]
MFDEYFAYFGLTGGVLLIIGIGLLLFLLIAIILERRTKMLFPERHKPKSKADDDFLSFDDEEDED